MAKPTDAGPRTGAGEFAAQVLHDPRRSQTILLTIAPDLRRPKAGRAPTAPRRRKLVRR